MVKAHRVRCPKFKKNSKGKKHMRCRSTCKLCGRKHSASQHRFHGIGSYKRTH